MERRHPTLPLGLEVRERLLCHRDRALVEVLDEIISRSPRLRRRLPHDDVHAKAKADLPSERRGPATNVGNLLRHRGRRLAPREIHIDVVSGEFVRRFRRTAHVDRRVRALDRRKVHPRPFHGEVFALEIDGLAGQDALIDR